MTIYCNRSTLTLWLYGSIVSVLSCGVSPAAAGEVEPVLLRYGWQANQKYAYKVEIQATNKDSKETLSGTPVFSVKSVSKDGAQVHITGERLASRTETKPGEFPGRRPPRIPSIPRIGGPGVVAGHELTLDLRGRVVKESGNSSVPYLLGDLQDLILPKFPDQADKTWKATRELVIRVTQQGRIPSPFRDDVELKRMNAEETLEYSLMALDEKSATISAEYSLKTVETIDGEPVIEVTGDGTILFDRVRGVPARIDYAGKIVEREENSQTKVPLTISISLLSPEEQAKQAAEDAARAAALKAPPTAEERVEILESLKSADFSKWLKAVQALKQKQPGEADAEVAAALAAQFATNDKNRRFQVAQALEVWATDNEVPLLVETLADEFQPTANSAMAALGRLKAAAAAEPLVKQLDKQAARLFAGKALKALGQPAEAAVQKAVESNDWTVRLEAVSILSEIGTAKSLESLKSRAENDSNALIRQRAKDAVGKIEKQGGDPKP